ncbi:MAG: UDP-N-acetylglucosamine 2-epimerase (non-hydrolyzing) [Proteobacteria bacterium]|nr:UDP-N-acetylglucosamine 2-epimerase (non-hydrolyzing) [Pseudomonadota bacterium]
MKKILVTYGTRPELIKMAPVIKKLGESLSFNPITCSTGQHRDLLDQVASFFGIQHDFSLNVMKSNQDLFDITERLLGEMREVLKESKPDLVLVQGDTTTAFVSALSAFYSKIPVGHIEAGLRTWDPYSPFPEEMNRALISKIASFHFAPTSKAADNLRKEGISEQLIYQVGNTGVDAILEVAKRGKATPFIAQLFPPEKKLILLTAHRRENFGEPLRNIFKAVKKLCKQHPDVQVIYPVHPNPNVKAVANEMLADCAGVTMLEPLEFGDLVWLLEKVQFVVTDSGGLQEEAPTFGKPVLVLRESTERPEAVEAGAARLVGTDSEKISAEMSKLVDPLSLQYQSMARVRNPFGDGTAARKIISILEQHFNQSVAEAA